MKKQNIYSRIVKMLRLNAILLLCLGLIHCGQKGPLYIMEKEIPQAEKTNAATDESNIKIKTESEAKAKAELEVPATEKQND